MVLVTKTSEVACSDTASKDNLTKFFPKYQMQLLATQLSKDPQSVEITTAHNSVNDCLIALFLPDTNGVDSTYIKQRHTLFSAAQILGMENGVYDKNEEFNFFYKINFDRGNNSDKLYSKSFMDIAQIK